MSSASSAVSQKNQARPETDNAPDEIESSLRRAIAALLVRGSDQSGEEYSRDFMELAAKLEELLEVYMTQLRPRVRAAEERQPFDQ